MLPKILIYAGVLLIVVGLLWILGNKIGIQFGKLPGDISIKKDDFSFYFPITTAIILSIIVSLILWIISRFIR